jgi:hypothetical protein
VTALTRLIEQARAVVAIEQARRAEQLRAAIRKEPLLQWYEQTAIDEFHGWSAAGVLPVTEQGLDLMATAIELEHVV